MTFDDFKVLASKVENLELPGKKALFKMAPMERVKELKDVDIKALNPREAAVTALFYPNKDNQTFLILILRKTYKGVHSAQIGFPGGKVEPEDKDLKDTAKMRGKVGSFLIPSEFKAGYSHIRGAFAAAKYSEQNVSKASSPFEFYIVQKKNGAHHIDNDHTVFGRVTKGMDVVDKINAVETDDSEWPLRNIPITVEVLD